MSYPRDLDEYTESELAAEIERRLAHHRAGTCDYCGRVPESSSCRFPQRHRGQPSPVTPEDASMHPARPDEAPVLTLRKRTPAEARAYRDGARLAINLILGQLHGVVKHPADVTLPTADVRAACEYAHGMIQAADELATVTPADAARGYGVEVDDDELLKPTPPEADPESMTEPLSAQVAAHLRKLTAELREAQRRIADLEAGMRRMQDEAAAKGVEIAIPTPSASS